MRNLFGSYGRGEAHPRSDVDLLVILDNEYDGDDPEFEIARGVPHPFPMDILVRTRQQVTTRLSMGDSFMRDIVEKSMLLYERPGA